MTAGEFALVVGAVLCALAFAALAVTLVRVHDTLTELRSDVEAMRHSADHARDVVSTARADLDRFDRVLGSAEAISGAVGKSNRLARTAFSTPVIKAAGIATGTSRAVKRLRRGA